MMVLSDRPYLFMAEQEYSPKSLFFNRLMVKFIRIAYSLAVSSDMMYLELLSSLPPVRDKKILIIYLEN